MHQPVGALLTQLAVRTQPQPGALRRALWRRLLAQLGGEEEAEERRRGVLLGARLRRRERRLEAPLGGHGEQRLARRRAAVPGELARRVVLGERVERASRRELRELVARGRQHVEVDALEEAAVAQRAAHRLLVVLRAGEDDEQVGLREGVPLLEKVEQARRALDVHGREGAAAELAPQPRALAPDEELRAVPAGGVRRAVDGAEPARVRPEGRLEDREPRRVGQRPAVAPAALEDGARVGDGQLGARDAAAVRLDGLLGAHEHVDDAEGDRVGRREHAQHQRRPLLPRPARQQRQLAQRRGYRRLPAALGEELVAAPRALEQAACLVLLAEPLEGDTEPLVAP